MRTVFVFSWTADGDAALGRLGARASVRAVLVDHLTAAVARRELRADTDVELCGAMIHDLYLADFRQAIFGRWNLAALEAQMRSQVSVLLDGLRPLAA